MSIKVMSWVWENSDTSGSVRLVLLALADSANDDGICWPGLETIAKKARISKRYVIEIIKQLEDKGSLKVERRRATEHKNLSNIYKVVMYSSQPIASGSEPGFTRTIIKRN